MDLPCMRSVASQPGCVSSPSTDAAADWVPSGSCWGIWSGKHWASCWSSQLSVLQLEYSSMWANVITNFPVILSKNLNYSSWILLNKVGDVRGRGLISFSQKMNFWPFLKNKLRPKLRSWTRIFSGGGGGGGVGGEIDYPARAFFSKKMHFFRRALHLKK